MNMTRCRRILWVVLLLAGLGGARLWRARQPERPTSAERVRQTRLMMGTVVHLDVCPGGISSDQVDHAYQEVWRRMEEIAWRMNVFDAKSDVTALNQSGGRPMTVRPDLYAVLREAGRMWRLTGKAFDITVEPLILLWRRQARENRWPSPEEVQRVKRHVGMEKVALLEGNRVRLVDPETRLDLGGIAKGYAIDEAARIFRRYGVTNFFIDAGGDIYVGGLNCRGERWHIGIRDPADPKGVVAIVYLSDQAVTTSGNYERFYEINGRRVSHIIDPVTGYPQKEIASATVIAPTAIVADALSTALTVQGARRGLALIDRLGEGYAALMIRKSAKGRAQRLESQGLGRYGVVK